MERAPAYIGELIPGTRVRSVIRVQKTVPSWAVESPPHVDQPGGFRLQVARIARQGLIACGRRLAGVERLPIGAKDLPPFHRCGVAAGDHPRRAEVVGMQFVDAQAINLRDRLGAQVDYIPLPVTAALVLPKQQAVVRIEELPGPASIGAVRQAHAQA